MSDEEFSAVSRMYATDNEKEIRYVDFIKDTRIYEMKLWSSTDNKVYGNYGNTTIRRPENEIVLLESLKNIVKNNRLRLNEYFKDFDPLRKGIIPANKFRGVLSQNKYFFFPKHLDLTWMKTL